MPLPCDFCHPLCCALIFLLLPSVFALPVTFTATSAWAASYICCCPLFLFCLFKLCLAFVPFLTFFLCHFYLLQLTVLTPPGSNLIAAHGVHTFVSPVSFIAALSLCTASLFIAALSICTAIFICWCLGICTAIPIFCNPFHVWMPCFFTPVSFVDALSICSLNSLLPMVFVPPVQVFALPVMDCPWYFHHHFSFLLPSGLLHGRFHNVAALGVAPQFYSFSVLRLLCHLFHWLLSLAFALLRTFNFVPSFIMSTFLVHACSPPFATRSLHII